MLALLQHVKVAAYVELWHGCMRWMPGRDAVVLMQFMRAVPRVLWARTPPVCAATVTIRHLQAQQQYVVDMSAFSKVCITLRSAALLQVLQLLQQLQ